MSVPVEQKIVTAHFGTVDGAEVSIFRIPNNTNDYIEVSDYGCTIKGIHIHGRDGQMHNVLCGYDTLEEYQTGRLDLGAVTGTLNGHPLPTAHRHWNVEEVGENHLFLSCRLPAESTPAGIACAVGARVMWVNLNRIVIDLFATLHLPYLRLSSSATRVPVIRRLYAAHLLSGGPPGRAESSRCPDLLWRAGLRPPGEPPPDLCL